MISWKIQANTVQVEAFFKTKENLAGPMVGAVMERSSYLLKETIRSFVPVDTGKYRDSFRIEKSSGSKNHYSFEVGTDEPYGERLERGFMGVTSDGEIVNQPPRPHIAPAMNMFERPFYAAIREVLT